MAFRNSAPGLLTALLWLMSASAASTDLVGYESTAYPERETTVAQIMGRPATLPLPLPVHQNECKGNVTDAPAEDAALDEHSQWVAPSVVAPESEPYAFPFSVASNFEMLSGMPQQIQDANGAVGPTQIMVALNSRIRVFDKISGEIGPLDTWTRTFFEDLFRADPNVRYDRLAQRWYVLGIGRVYPSASNTNPDLVFAVSDGPIITAATVWRFYRIDARNYYPSGAQCFIDFPSLGWDARAVYAGGNLVCSKNGGPWTPANSVIFVMRKTTILSSADPLVVTAFGLGFVGNPKAAVNDDPDAASGYFIASHPTQLYRVNDPGGTPTVTTLTVPGGPPFCTGTCGIQQKGSPELFHCGGTQEARIKNGHLFNVTRAGIDPENPDACGARAALRWYDFDLNESTSGAPSLHQWGTVLDQQWVDGDRDYFVPSIAVSGQDHLLIGASYSGIDDYIGIAAAGRLATAPLGTTSQPAALVVATTPFSFSSSSDARWGDYSYTEIDPDDDMTFWTFQSFCDGVDTMGIRAIRILPPPPAHPQSCSPPSVAHGRDAITVTIAATSTDGSAFFDPGPAFARRPAVAVSGDVSVSDVKVLDKTTLEITISTNEAAPGLQTITVTNPDGQSVTSASILEVLPPAPAVPSSLDATAIDPTSISVGWAAAAHATTYEVLRDSGAGSYQTIAVVPSTTHLDAAVQPGHAYAYRVRAIGAGGASQYTTPALATTISFTDATLVPHTTPIRATHVLELRHAVAAVHSLAGLGPVVWSRPLVTTGDIVRAAEISELREALAASLSHLGIPAPAFTDSPLSPRSTTISAAHIQQLRAAVR